MKEEKEGADMELPDRAEGSVRKRNGASFLDDWPVGQVVKTAASHAVNIGSNPVWVTNELERGSALRIKDG